MAPGAVVDDFSSHDGQALEVLSDKIDDVNVIKYDETSKFDKEKDKNTFRQYADATDRVKNFYREQHHKQTVAYNLAARNRFYNASRPRAEMTIWEAMEKLNTLVDESDPDTSLSQIQHLLQSAEAIRRDGKPRWMQLTGLIHDLGKLMLFFPELETQDHLPQTFAEGNPDAINPDFNTKYGIYSPNCGLDNVMLSWGHDEYLYHVVKDQSTLPDEALAMIRYHSFYPWHREGAYRHLMCDKDHEMLKAVNAFNPYDLYSKSDGVPDAEKLKPYYMELISEYFPNPVIKW
ncbi:hypothetical protein FoTM2_005386 [Fusarium oxysporum f. sp. vasinfectum]|nr:hypothetical protein FoTM2_005386 [Fusarium oxysporum f. sp. vasinfectum]